jgi:VCBS repeat-containing protein
VQVVPVAGFAGATGFTYTITDADGDTATATVTVNFGVAANLPPIAGADAFSGAEDAAITGNVLDNDVDASPLSAVLETGPASAASFTLNANGSFTYVPLANFNGTDSFTYRAFDGALSSALTTVMLTVTPVNDLPTAGNGVLSVAEDSAATTVDLLALLGAADVEGPLSLVSVEATSLGLAVVNADGTYQFTPAANANGTDTLDVVISDGVAQITRTLALTVTPVNDAPVATDDTGATTFETPVALAITQLLANDTDQDGDTLALTAVAAGTGGAVVIQGGNVVFTPAAGFSGQASFTYTVSDGQGSLDTATVVVTVQPNAQLPPVGVDDEGSGAEDTAITGNVLDNDTDANADLLTAVVAGLPAHGTLVLAADGSFTYTPNANFSGTDSFTYRPHDGSGPGNLTTVRLVVTPVNDAPTATNAVLLTNEDTGFSGNLLALLGATDIDGDDLDIAAIGTTALGSFTVNQETGDFSFTPTANANGVGSVNVTITDGTASVTATLQLNISAVNDAPVALAETYASVAGQALVVAAAGGVLANDTDIDGPALTAQLGTGPANGTLLLNADGSFTYTPNAGFSGADSFTYTAFDGTAASAATTVTLNISPAGGGTAPVYGFSQGFTGTLPTLQSGPAATPAELAAFVREGSATLDGTTYHLVENIGLWNALKNVALGAFDPSFGTAYAIANFVSVDADFSTAGTTALDLLVIGAKRSDLATGGGDDSITLTLNSRSWGGNANRIDSGGGSDTVLVTGVGNSTLDNVLLADNAVPGNGHAWNAAYQGGFDHAVTVHAGSGNDTVTIAGSFAARIFGGAGLDVLTGGAVRDLLDGGADADTLTGGGGRDTFQLRAGEAAGDAITDFAAGDVIRLVGFGAGATLANLGGGSFQVGGETFTVAGAATLVAGVDYIFA